MASSSLGCSTDSPTEALRAVVTDEVFLLLLLSILPTSFSSSPPQKTSFQVCSLLTRTIK